MRGISRAASVWRRRGVFLLALLAALSVHTSPARAQRSAEKAAADALFSEGKKLVIAGELEAACEKFEASLARVRQLGAQLALGSCYEQLGKTASAWGEFRAAARAAARGDDVERERFAKERAAALEAKLSRLMIRTEPGYRVDDLVVRRNGDEIDAAELGTPVPVDPGVYTIEAQAPGWQPWSSTVTVSVPGVFEVVVPALGKAPVKVEEEPAAMPSRAPRAQRAAPRRTLAYAVGGAGAGMVLASLALGSLASSRWSDAQAHCSDGRCDQEGVDLAASASNLGTLSTVTFALGAVTVATGTYLWLTARAAEPAVRAVPSVGPEHAGLWLQGEF